jgi:hypothetical protein
MRNPVTDRFERSGSAAQMKSLVLSVFLTLVVACAVCDSAKAAPAKFKDTTKKVGKTV